MMFRTFARPVAVDGGIGEPDPLPLPHPPTISTLIANRSTRKSTRLSNLDNLLSFNATQLIASRSIKHYATGFNGIEEPLGDAAGFYRSQKIANDFVPSAVRH